MRPEGNASELERRRRRAFRLMEEGESPSVIVRFLGCSRSSIYRWKEQAESVQDGLAAKPQPGRRRRLSPAEHQRLERMLRRGSPSLRLVKRPLDCLSCGRTDPAEVWQKVPCRARPQDGEGTLGLDQSETRTPGLGEGRSLNSTLAVPGGSAFQSASLKS